MSTPNNRLQSAFAHQAKTLAPEGWICQGSAIERAYTRSAGGKKKHYGPYYSWTRKVDDKTITIALSREQFVLLRKAIRRHQALNAAIQKLRQLSERYILGATRGVTKRCVH